MTLVHTVTESEAAANIIDDQSNVRRPVVFEEARNADEELIIHQEGLLFTSNEPEEPVSTLKIASARVLDVQQHGTSFLLVIRICSPSYFPIFFLSDTDILAHK